MSQRPLSYTLAAVALAVGGTGLWILLSDDASPDEGGPVDVVRGEGAAAPTVPEVPFAARGAGRDDARVEPERATPTGPGTLWVRVVDTDSGRPVTAFTVDLLEHDEDAEATPLERLERLEQLDANRTEVYRPRTGVFRAEHPAGTYDMIVRARGFEPLVRTVTVPSPPERPVLVGLERGAQLVGQVRDQYGMFVGDVDVFLRIDRLDSGSRPPTYTKEHTGRDGVFRFSPLDPGTYTVVALTPTNADDRVRGIRVDEGITEVQLTLTPHNQVEVVLADPQRRPIGGARVTLTGGGRTWSATSSADTGRAALRFVPEGTYAVSIVRRPFEPVEDTIEVRGGEGVALRYFTLTRQG